MLTFCGESLRSESVQKGLKKAGAGGMINAATVHTVDCPTSIHTFLSKFTVFPLQNAPIQCHATVIHTECI